MKRDQLRVGATYSDGKKGLRRIIAFGPEYTLYSSQTEHDCLLYAVVKGKAGRDRGHTEQGEALRHSTAGSFAAWARSEAIEYRGLTLIPSFPDDARSADLESAMRSAAETIEP